MTAPALFLGLCDVCCSVKFFTTEQARNGWELYHPHEREEYGDE
jgi:hypothetical protein